MFGHGGVSAIAGPAHVAGDPLALVEDLDGARGDAGLDLLTQQRVGDGVVMAGDLDVVVEADGAVWNAHTFQAASVGPGLVNNGSKNKAGIW